MIDPGKAVKESSAAEPPAIAPACKIISGVIFGFAFGFLLQKGGVGTYHILIGQLLFQDWTVVRIMMTAPRGAFVVAATVLLSGALYLLERAFPR